MEISCVIITIKNALAIVFLIFYAHLWKQFETQDPPSLVDPTAIVGNRSTDSASQSPGVKMCILAFQAPMFPFFKWRKMFQC